MIIDQIAADLAFCLCVSNNDKFDLGVNTLKLYELNCVTGDTNCDFFIFDFYRPGSRVPPPMLPQPR